MSTITLPDQFLSIEQVAARYGVQRATVYAWTSQRRIPHMKIGKHLRFREEDLREWEERHLVTVRG